MGLSHLGHCELEVTDLEASARFFTEVLGLTASTVEDGRVYLRAWQDWDHHTLLLTEARESRLNHMGWRAPEREDVLEIESRLKDLGVETAWVEGNVGHGDALRFLTPGGLSFEVYWEVEKYQAPPELASVLPSHPQRFPNNGAAPRRFDHMTYNVNDVVSEQEWLTRELGIHHRYYRMSEDGTRWGSWMSRTCLSHEIGMTRNLVQSGGELNHVAFYSDSPDEVLRAATLLVDSGTPIEWGPGKHATSGATFLYFKEPSGHRVEIWTGGLLIFSPDWEPILWKDEVGALGMDLWGTQVPRGFHEGTPIAGLPAAA
jgi:catechol 2,3-dioxygenase